MIGSVRTGFFGLGAAAVGAALTLGVLVGSGEVSWKSAVAADAAGAEAGDVIARSLASSVQLFAERAGGVRRSASGVVLSTTADGSAIILTAAHLLAPAASQSVFVSLPGRDSQVEATILTIDVEADVAVLEAHDLAVRPVELKPSAHLGDDVWVVSFPWGQRGTVVGGRVSQVRGPEANGFPVEGPVGLIDAAVSYGTSGGGVFDAESGRLVGIVRGYRTAKLTIPGTPSQALEFPIAGETTVVPIVEILCTLDETILARRPDLSEMLAAHPAGCARS
jgi:hypothetical protein